MGTSNPNTGRCRGPSACGGTWSPGTSLRATITGPEQSIAQSGIRVCACVQEWRCLESSADLLTPQPSSLLNSHGGASQASKGLRQVAPAHERG